MRNFLRISGAALGVSLVLASAAFGQSMGQVFEKGMKPLIGGNGHIVHGNYLEAFISAKVAWLGVDCQDTVSRKGVVPAYAERIYGRKTIRTAPCLPGPNGWYDSKQYQILPIPRGAYRQEYRHLHVQSRQRTCRGARRTVRKGEPLNKHAQFPCSRLRSTRLYKSGSALFRYQCPSGRSHAARKVWVTIRRVYPQPHGTLLILRFTRRSCYRGAVEKQVVDGIWSKPRPRPDPMPRHKHH